MSSLSQAASGAEKRTNARYWIVVMLFIVTSFNYGDRATLSIAGSEMAKDIGLDAVGMGYVFSAFSWAYVIGQIPGGWLLDRFGSKRVYFWSIFIWSMFTLLQGFVDIFSGQPAPSSRRRRPAARGRISADRAWRPARRTGSRR